MCLILAVIISAWHHVRTMQNQRSKEGQMPVIDVDGSYLTRKMEKLKDSGVNTAPLKLPSIPPAGWNIDSTDNYQHFTDKIPKMMAGTFKQPLLLWQTTNLNTHSSLHLGTVYTYLAQGVGHHSGDERACCALSRGYT